MTTISTKKIEQLTVAARDKSLVSGLTHKFYRYPARFSPQFAASAIKCFSKPGDLVLDPYMGGGTTIVEALAAGRRAVGNDLNSLAAFIAKVKTTPLRSNETKAISNWANNEVPLFSYRTPQADLVDFLDQSKMKNLNLVRSRFITKIAACALSSISHLPTKITQRFAKCVLLRVSQLALDGRKSHTSLNSFRNQLTKTTEEMLTEISLFTDAARHSNQDKQYSAIIANLDAEQLPALSIFAKQNEQANLVVTSPPYPGVHVLYHRWQVDGRRETPAPYWIAGCNDGQGTSFYNFGDRHDKQALDYFASSLRTLTAIRKVMADDAIIVQMVAFSKPKSQLPRYLDNMKKAGFKELRANRNQGERIWREVPNRRWHANYNGHSNGSREVVLIHTTN